MMTEKRFRVHELSKYNYSEIGEYTDENHTDKPLRNDEVVELLNELDRLAEANEEQGLAIMTYLHDNYYDIWEEVNKELFKE